MTPLTKFLVRIGGPSYKTSLTGWAEALAATFFGLAVAPYTLGDISTVIDPGWKPFFFKAAGVCYIVSKLLNALWSKASNVSGVSSTGTIIESKGETVAVLPPAPASPEPTPTHDNKP